MRRALRLVRLLKNDGRACLSLIMRAPGDRQGVEGESPRCMQKLVRHAKAEQNRRKGSPFREGRLYCYPNHAERSI